MTRKEQVAGERRRRKSGDLAGARKRLAINEAALDRDQYEYRFITDDPTRIHQLTVQDDWEVVTDRDGDIRHNSDGSGSEVAILSGVGEGGRPQRSVLVRKLKAYHDEDTAEKQRRIDVIEEGMTRGPEGAAGEKTYTPGSRDGSGKRMAVSVER